MRNPNLVVRNPNLIVRNPNLLVRNHNLVVTKDLNHAVSSQYVKRCVVSKFQLYVNKYSHVLANVKLHVQHLWAVKFIMLSTEKHFLYR